MMNRVWIGLALVMVLAVAGMGYWASDDSALPEQKVAAAPAAAAPAADPLPQVAEPEEQPAPEAEDSLAAVEGETEAVPAQEEASTAPETLTAETLKGTRWEDGPVEMEFMPDGQWKMNGRICAKWVVEDDRVKIYDDKGEVHYVDIVGNKIAFNGKTIGRTAG